MMTSSRGAALIDLVAALCGLDVILAAIAIPTLHAARHADEARVAARYLAHRLQMLRVAGDAPQPQRRDAVRSGRGRAPGRLRRWRRRRRACSATSTAA